ncbi:hypothetical protein ACVWXL_001561 [Bradyrhizobium sp. GM22.5]
MRHQHVVGIAAVAIDAERARRQAHVLVTGETGRAFAATDPGIDQPDIADLHVALVRRLHVRAEGEHLADRLVPHGQRQVDAAVLQRERLAAVAEIVATFPNVKVAMADAGGLHLDQHLRAGRLRRGLIELLQRRLEIGDLETFHWRPPGYFSCRRHHGMGGGTRQTRTCLI